MAASPSDFDGFSINEIARLCKVSPKTARRWKLGTSCPPPSAIMIVKGDLGVFDKEWSGWVIRRGMIYSPEGVEATTGDIMALQFMRQQIAIYQAENRKLREAGTLMDEQPVPQEWPVLVNEL